MENTMPEAKEETSVFYVRRQDAKAVKIRLERASLLDKRFRMAPVVADTHGGTSDAADADGAADDEANSISWIGHGDRSLDGGEKGRPQRPLIAVPVTAECVGRFHRYYDHIHCKDVNYAENRDENGTNQVKNGEIRRSLVDEEFSSGISDVVHYIVGFGRQPCPFSTSMLGNNNKNRRRKAPSGIVTGGNMTSSNHHNTLDTSSMTNNPCHSDESTSPLTLVQCALIETLSAWLTKNGTPMHGNQPTACINNQTIERLVRELSVQTCPKKLEIMGDDRTLVLPRSSLFIVSPRSSSPREEEEIGMKAQISFRKKGCSEFREFLLGLVRGFEQEKDVETGATNTIDPGQQQIQTNNNSSAKIHEIQSQLWKNLANIYNSPRVVRRGDIDPESGVRKSGHRILWPTPTVGSTSGDSNSGFLPGATGPGSPGWITATEHGIRQSFDLARVMFSRGNFTEKRRFGSSLVQPGERVLDMYAGIGYYTLPALIHGRAGHVTACEWNRHALDALRHNLKANGVDERATVVEGDCRASLKGLTTAEDGRFDRVSLGLLPSSEGGWPVAVSCLRRDAGGWLHIHGNVPTAERRDWAHWVCRSLARIAEQQAVGASHPAGWIAVCTHVERVKSFAPNVDHVVADVLVIPRHSPKMPPWLRSLGCTTGVVDSPGEFIPTPVVVSPPSCALHKDGILHQNWLREDM